MKKFIKKDFPIKTYPPRESIWMLGRKRTQEKTYPCRNVSGKWVNRLYHCSPAYCFCRLDCFQLCTALHQEQHDDFSIPVFKFLYMFFPMIHRVVDHDCPDWHLHEVYTWTIFLLRNKFRSPDHYISFSIS